MHSECGIIAISIETTFSLKTLAYKLKNEEGYLDFTITIYFGLCQWNIFYEEKIIQTLPWVRNKDADRVSNPGWKRVT